MNYIVINNLIFFAFEKLLKHVINLADSHRMASVESIIALALCIHFEVYSEVNPCPEYWVQATVVDIWACLKQLLTPWKKQMRIAKMRNIQDWWKYKQNNNLYVCKWS